MCGDGSIGRSTSRQSIQCGPGEPTKDLRSATANSEGGCIPHLKRSTIIRYRLHPHSCRIGRPQRIELDWARQMPSAIMCAENHVDIQASLPRRAHSLRPTTVTSQPPLSLASKSAPIISELEGNYLSYSTPVWKDPKSRLLTEPGSNSVFSRNGWRRPRCKHLSLVIGNYLQC